MAKEPTDKCHPSNSYHRHNQTLPASEASIPILPLPIFKTKPHDTQEPDRSLCPINQLQKDGVDGFFILLEFIDVSSNKRKTNQTHVRVRELTEVHIEV